MRISLEIAHTALLPTGPPSRQRFDQACLIGRSARDALEERGHDVDVALLIDDKRQPVNEHNAGEVEMILAWAAEFTRVDYWTSERQLSLYREDLLNLLTSPVMRDARTTSLDRYVADHGYLPCSADIAIWHLLRLGVIHDKHSVLHAVGGYSTSVYDRRTALVASVLPEHVRDHESTADRSYLKHIDSRLPERVHRLYFPASADVDEVRVDSLHAFLAEIESHGERLSEAEPLEDERMLAEYT